ncbi:MAG: 2-oxo acid dehydrogenase subunit E2 [Alphaproteobacteria bacterium]|nr:2-oxo acid dehydrogenase subunit E2 [Alphaproteobacteria bacterium]MDE2629716.1 2-oxo acid dehydrogenase subunit E2 [Alphaproteobacteria bacterium]
MGRYVFKLPDVGEGTTDAEIVAWHVKVGDTVKEEQDLVDVMTDKATVEMTCPVAGKIVALHGELGQKTAVGAPLVELEVDGAGNIAGNGKAVPVAETKPAAKNAEPVPPEPRIAAAAKGKPLASPAVRQRARALGIELSSVPGRGPEERITHADLDSFIMGGNALRAAARDGVEDVKVIGLRRKIAEKMQESKRRIPHYTYVEEIDMTELEAMRAHLNATKRADQPKLNVLPFLMRALVRVLPDFPQINATFDDEAGVVHRHRATHVGIATQTENGLIVPVVRHAESLDLWSSAREIARVAAAARENKAAKEELSGSTITLTSLGAMGGLATTPVINHPEVAIIGPNAIVERAVVRGGQIAVRKMMNLSSSYDHRVVDGHDAATFIQRLKALLEHPAMLFME